MVVLLAGSCTLGCGDESAVSVSVTVGSPQLELRETPFGDQFVMEGSFELFFELGSLAEERASVSFEGASLTPAEQPGVEVTPFTTSFEDGAFPVSLGPGERESVLIRVGAEETLIGPGGAGNPPGKAELCSGQAQFRGAVRDGSTARKFASPAFDVDGC